MRRLTIPLALAAMAALVGAAFVWDCIRLDRNHQEQLALADTELKKNEDRLVQALRGLGSPSPALEAAMKAHAGATDRDARQAAYSDLRAAAEQALAQAPDASQPATRKVVDEVSGAINRRRVAEAPFQAQVAEWKRWRESFRGSVARGFRIE